MPRRILRTAKSLSFVRALRWVLWGLLAAAAVLAVFPVGLESGVREGRLPRILLLIPAVFFGGFLVTFAVYRFALVRAGRYNAGKAFIQVGLGVLVLLFLAPQGLERYRDATVPASAPVDLRPLLERQDPAVRAAACEALAHRAGDAEAKAKARALAKTDPDPRVRAACDAVR